MFGERLRELRKEKGLTMKEFGKLFNLAESTISGYENETRKPDMDILQKFADYFMVTVDYLLGRSDERTADDSASKKVETAISDDPELLEFWNELTTRDDLVLMFKQAKDLSPEAIKRIIKYIKMVEDEEAQEDF